MGFSDTGSLKMRIQNVKAVDGGVGGLGNYAKLTEKIYKEYRAVSQEGHRQKCLEILNSG